MKRLAALCTTVIVAIAGLAAAAPAQAAGGPSVLTVGHSWTDVSLPSSPSGEYSLGIYFYGLQLGQDIDTKAVSIGTDTWTSQPRAKGRCARPRLTMQADGAAVLHCGAQRLWATPTKGTGSGNSFRIRDTGRLVVTTRTGQVVWRSHSGPALMAAGTQLLPGQYLLNCSGSGPCQSLTMRRNGDLALRYGKRVDWHTRTAGHAGARLVFTRSGALQVVGPHGRILWRSHTGGVGPATYLIVDLNPPGTAARLDMASESHPKFRWTRP